MANRKERRAERKTKSSPFRQYAVKIDQEMGDAIERGDPDYQGAILHWAIAHCGPDCSPNVSRDDDGELVLSVTRKEHGTHECYHLLLEPWGYRTFRIRRVTVDRKTVH
jgi:hypothetical protein